MEKDGARRELFGHTADRWRMQEASMPIVLRQEREICEKKASKKVQQISILLAISQKIGMFHKALRAIGEPEQLCFK